MSLTQPLCFIWILHYSLWDSKQNNKIAWNTKIAEWVYTDYYHYSYNYESNVLQAMIVIHMLLKVNWLLTFLVKYYSFNRGRA